MKKKTTFIEPLVCGANFAMSISDTMDVLSGKWKLPILGVLMHQTRRFNELQRDLPKITAKMLSKELQDLEFNQLITRTAFDTFPITVEYRITEHGLTLSEVLISMNKWGTIHRQKIIGNKDTE